MNKQKISVSFVIFLAAVLIAGCARTRPTGFGGPPGSTPAAAATATPQPTTEAASATLAPEASRTPAPTLDMISLLVTQAYQQVTLAPRSTQAAPATAAGAANVPLEIAGLLTPTATLDPAPAAVIFSEPILLTNAVSTADCKIRDTGNCTPIMQAGSTLFFSWTFGVEGAASFHWGQAAVVITRNDETFKWTQTGNGLVRAPDFTKNESWTLNVGQSAKFSAGLEDAQPGYYTARLLMCTLAPDECSAGQGWQNVGGQAINFVIEP